jgi:hypothetical protein
MDSIDQIEGDQRTVTPMTKPGWGLFEFTNNAKSWSWMCKYGLKSPAGLNYSQDDK